MEAVIPSIEATQSSIVTSTTPLSSVSFIFSLWPNSHILVYLCTCNFLLQARSSLKGLGDVDKLLEDVSLTLKNAKLLLKPLLPSLPWSQHKSNSKQQLINWRSFWSNLRTWSFLTLVCWTNLYRWHDFSLPIPSPLVRVVGLFWGCLYRTLMVPFLTFKQLKIREIKLKVKKRNMSSNSLDCKLINSAFKLRQQNWRPLTKRWNSLRLNFNPGSSSNLRNVWNFSLFISRVKDWFKGWSWSLKLSKTCNFYSQRSTTLRCCPWWVGLVYLLLSRSCNQLFFF